MLQILLQVNLGPVPLAQTLVASFAKVIALIYTAVKYMIEPAEPYRHISAQEAACTITDTIIPFTYTTNIDFGEGYYYQRLSALSEASIAAARHLWTAHTAASILIAGETTFGPGTLSTAEKMKEWAVEHNIPDNQIIALTEINGRSLDNTPTQVQALMQAYRGTYELYRRPAIVVAMSYHAERIRTHSEAYGLPVNTVAVEDILVNVDHLDEHPAIAHTEPLAYREELVRRLSKFDPKGRILNLLTRIQGPRLHDVVLDETGGSYTTIISTAAKRLGELSIPADAIAETLRFAELPEAA